jgi:cytochrome bd-type quinol oxidase subunit 1
MLALGTRSSAFWILSVDSSMQTLTGCAMNADGMGDAHGLDTLEHQPAKVLAMEDYDQSRPGRRTAEPVGPAHLR